MLNACAPPTFDTRVHRTHWLPRATHLLNTALTWRADAPRRDGLYGARLLYDGGPQRAPALALTRAILHTNLQISPIDALALATSTVRAARLNGLPPEFLGATLLQESAYDPRALSSAGAVGIAQFTLATAAERGVNPNDPLDSIAGAAALLGDYVIAYRARYADPYAAALAAYNAGPGAVEAYHGVPPFAETRSYIDDIVYREARIYLYEE
jgi:soluble lytic murein transglycosylase-like protein